MASDQMMLSEEGWDRFPGYWRAGQRVLPWDCVFMLPFWLDSWCRSFGAGTERRLFVGRRNEQVMGLAPLLLKGGAARIMGSSNVVDYGGLNIVSGEEEPFLESLLSGLAEDGVALLDTGPFRTDDAAMQALQKVGEHRGDRCRCAHDGSVFEMKLPRSWEEYLSQISKKERHEIRRKLRRLDESGEVTYRVLSAADEVRDGIDIFIRLFRRNVQEKAEFMSHRMETFFRSLADALAEEGLIRLSILSVDTAPAAATLCFDYHSTVFLYNNAYDRHFELLSVGYLSKVMSIRDTIERGKKKYNFLKGDEEYKKRLGGLPVPLNRCRLSLQ